MCTKRACPAGAATQLQRRPAGPAQVELADGDLGEGPSGDVTYIAAAVQFSVELARAVTPRKMYQYSLNETEATKSPRGHKNTHRPTEEGASIGQGGGTICDR